MIPVLAVAVTPIMKLLVVVETLNGSLIMVSMRGTSDPSAHAEEPGRRPPKKITTKPAGMRVAT